MSLLTLMRHQAAVRDWDVFPTRWWWGGVGGVATTESRGATLEGPRSVSDTLAEAPGALKDPCVWSRANWPNTIRGSWNLIQTFSQSLRDPPPLVSLGFHHPAVFCTFSAHNRKDSSGTRGSRPVSVQWYWNNTKNMAANR